jgi:hypothetical protein
MNTFKRGGRAPMMQHWVARHGAKHAKQRNGGVKQCMGEVNMYSRVGVLHILLLKLPHVS